MQKVQKVLVKEFNDDISIAKTQEDIIKAIRNYLDGFVYVDQNTCVRGFIDILSKSDLFTRFLINNPKFKNIFFNKLYQFAKEKPDVYQEYTNVFYKRIQVHTYISQVVHRDPKSVDTWKEMTGPEEKHEVYKVLRNRVVYTK